MADQEINRAVAIPTPGNWPGAFGAYKVVKPYVKQQIWNFVSLIGLALIASIIVQLVLNIIFRHGGANFVINELAGLAIGAYFVAVAIVMYFKSLNNDEFVLNDAIRYGYQKVLKMLGLIIVMYVLLVISFILFIVPFFFLLPRIYLAPYFFINNDSTVGEALAASWHLSKGHASEIYGIFLLNIAISLVALTIIGIPFAVYWWVINTGSFALFTMHLTQPKKATKQTNKKSAAKVSPA